MEENKNIRIEEENKDTEKKTKKKWSKKKKVGVICLVIILLAVITAFSFIFVAPTAYLADKYDEPSSMFITKEINLPRLYRYPTGVDNFLPIGDYTAKFSNPEWIFETDGKEYLVFYDLKKHRFYDDRQLEELENICVGYLNQKLESAKIAGIELHSEQLIDYYRNQYINVNKLGDDEVFDFLHSLRYYKKLSDNDHYYEQYSGEDYCPQVYIINASYNGSGLNKAVDDDSLKTLTQNDYEVLDKYLFDYSFVKSQDQIKRKQEIYNYYSVVFNRNYSIKRYYIGI